MLKLSRKFLFALEAVVDIAYNAGGHAVRHRDITQRQATPKRYLEQILQQLVRNRILVSIRGPRGGYRLARERRRITIGDICRVMNGLPDTPIADDGSRLSHEVITPLWEEIRQSILVILDRVTVEDICHRARTLKIPIAEAPTVDFSI